MKVESQELREYLLGGLPEEAAAVLDERLFEDEAFHREVQDAQESLVRDFVEHNLPFGDEERFRAQCARSPALQAAVYDVRALKAALERQRKADLRGRVSTIPWSWIFAFAVPAMALCIVSVYCLALLRGRDRLNSQVAALSRQGPAVSISEDDGHSFATVFLSANVLRGDSSIPSIVVPPGASLVELQVEVRTEPTDHSDRTVEILHGNEIVWRSVRVPLQRIEQETFLSVVLDRGDLPAGDYEIRYAASLNPVASVQRSFRVVSSR